MFNYKCSRRLVPDYALHTCFLCEGKFGYFDAAIFRTPAHFRARRNELISAAIQTETFPNRHHDFAVFFLIRMFAQRARI